MAKKQDQTASFMVRFNQKIFEENGKANVQWRGKISHIQTGADKNFSDFNDALVFMQKKLAELTTEAAKHQPKEERESILHKSFAVWKTVKSVAPKVIMDTLKDPKKQISSIQDQIQDQITNFSEELSEKVHLNEWRKASRADFNKIQDELSKLSAEIQNLSKKVDTINKKK